MAKMEENQWVNLGMGTVMSHKASGKHAQEALEAVSHEAVRLERLLSRFVPDSDICRINRNAGKTCEDLSQDTYEVLSYAIEFSRCCKGIFDVTIGPLVSLWNNGMSTCKLPKKERIEGALSLVNYGDLTLEPGKKAAGLRRIGQSIDLGGIGKGFAGHKFLEIFRKYGVSSAFTNLGGNVVTMGAKPDGSPWNVGIRHPRQENSLIGAVSVVDKAVVTSGDYQRCFMDSQGKRRHHILDPSNGYPAESGLISATVVADSSTTADALSTILFVAGMKRGIGLLGQFPGTEAIFVDEKLGVHITAGLKASFQADKGINLNVL